MTALLFIGLCWLGIALILGGELWKTRGREKAERIRADRAEEDLELERAVFEADWFDWPERDAA